MNFLDSSQVMDYALNRDRMRLKELSPIASFLLLVVVPIFALAAPREKAMVLSVRPLAVAADTKAEMARYSLKAYGNRDATNVVKGLLFTPKPVGMNALPMVVYIPGKGEIGEIEGHFRQRAIFDRVTSAEFQEKYPCFLLALTPPASATTILGGMPGHPTGLQKALRDFIFVNDTLALVAMERSGDVHALRYEAATGRFDVVSTLGGLFRPVPLRSH